MKKLSWNVSLAVKMMSTASVIAFETSPYVSMVSKIYKRFFFMKFLISNGILSAHNCISECPCEMGCLDGCDDCPNPVCECEVR